MEFSINIREAQFSDIEHICLIQESSQNSQDILTREILEERIRNFADTFLLASLNEQGIAYISATILTNDSLDKWIVTISKEGFRRDNSIILEEISVHPDFQKQGFGTLLLASLKEVACQKNSPAIYLLCKDELLSYFEMNGFLEQGIVEEKRSSEVAFLMCWRNPFYQEEL